MTVFPSEIAPSLTLPSVKGGEFTLADSKPDLFTIVVFYRGLHCPLCKMHMQEIEENLENIHAAGLQIVAVSMDPKDKAEAFANEVASNMKKSSPLEVPILYGLTKEQARHEWGLYLSTKRPGTDEPEIFSEPGLFVIRPDNTVFMAQTQSAPFTRPSMEQLVGGLTFATQQDYPARGTLRSIPSAEKDGAVVQNAWEDPVSSTMQ